MDRSVRKDPSLQSLRAVAFLGIFLTHVGRSYAWAGLSVSAFFVLSSCLLTQRCAGRELPGALRGQAAFAWRHIARIYPLHLICMVLYAVLRLIIEATVGLKSSLVLETLGLMALDTALLQSWWPHHLVNVSLNGVAWFLSSMLFLYFVFPPLIRRLRRMGSAARAALMLLIPAAQILTCVPLIQWDTDFYVYNWYSYCFPLFRLGDFAAGCCLGLFLLDRGEEKARGDRRITAMGTLLELILLGLTVGEMLLRRRGSASPWIKACFNNTSLYLWLALGWVYAFSVRRGLITRLLANPALVWVGDISGYAYLIHYLLTQYVYHSMALVRYTPQGWERTAVMLAELAATLLLSAAYRRIADLTSRLRADGRGAAA